MKRKKTIMIVSILLCLLIPVSLWSCTIIKNLYLTAAYGKEFTDYDSLGLEHLGAWDIASDLRVLHYSDNEATVYYFSKDCGEVIVFSKENDQWKYKQSDALWSAMGSADDFLIWPYIRNSAIINIHHLSDCE